MLLIHIKLEIAPLDNNRYPIWLIRTHIDCRIVIAYQVDGVFGLVIIQAIGSGMVEILEADQ